MIRRAGPADVVDLAVLDAGCFARPWPADEWRRELAQTGAGVWVWRDPAGTVGLAATRTLGADCELLRLGTLPAARRRGIGRDLLAHVVNWARQAECARVMLEVSASNLAAVRLYRGAGFTVVGRRKGYYAAVGEDAEVMDLRL